MAYTAVPDLAVYRRAMRSNVAIWYTVNASRDGSPITGATGLQPIGGSITDTTKPGVRRNLSVELAGTREIPSNELYDLLEPIGTTLTVTAHVRYTNRTVVDIPMGVFDVDSQKISEGDGRISLTAPDKWVRVIRARFLGPRGSYPNVTVVEQLSRMIRDALGQDEPVNAFATSTAMMTYQIWERDRDKAIIDLATSIGAWVYFDRDGVATIADAPKVGSTADWMIDAGAAGVLVELDRERSRTDTHNVVVVSSSATDGERFPSQIVWDDDPFSPTYAGTNPGMALDAGPFGVSPFFYDTPVLSTADQARAAGRTILARVSGLASQISASAVPNPAIDAWDSVEIITPGMSRLAVSGYREMYSGNTVPVVSRSTDGVVIERHTVDTVTHPLTVGPALQIDGRSTRAEAVEGS